MAEVKTIKGVTDDVWADFKSLAAKNKKKMGEFFTELIEEYKKKESKKFWDNVLTVKEPLTKYETDIIRTKVRKLREETGYRDIKWD